MGIDRGLHSGLPLARLPHAGFLRPGVNCCRRASRNRCDGSCSGAARHQQQWAACRCRLAACEVLRARGRGREKIRSAILAWGQRVQQSAPRSA